MRIHAVTLGVAVVAVAVGAPAVAHAAATPPTQSAASPTSRTCAEFRVWNAHRTPAHLRTLMADSLAVAWKGDGLSGDVYSLYGDVNAKDGYYTAADVRYIAKDCKNS